jgi:hypothetical protein
MTTTPTDRLTRLKENESGNDPDDR